MAVRQSGRHLRFFHFMPFRARLKQAVQEARLYQHRPWLSEDENKAAERQTSSLVGIVVILVLLVSSLFLVQHLRRSNAVEDCLMAGRRNCDLLVTSEH